MNAKECVPGVFVRHRLTGQRMIVVNRHVVEDGGTGVGGETTWVRVRDEQLKLYDMAAEELEPDGLAHA